MEDRHEMVQVIVGPSTLDYRCQPLETDRRVYVVFWKGFEGAVVFAVELDENIVPDFDHVRVTFVYQVRGITTADAIDVNFAVQYVRQESDSHSV
jgi:hypothetical protein